MTHSAAAQREAALRKANRVHCRQTRERRRNQERLLREEVVLLQLCRSIVESGPDLFSVHGLNPNAPFSFLCESYCRQLRIEPDDILGQPLSSIVDPRDAGALQNVVVHVLSGGDKGGSAAPPVAAVNNNGAGGGGFPCPSRSFAASTATGTFVDINPAATHKQQPVEPANSNGWGGRGGEGCLVNVRLARFGVTCHAGMSIAIGSQGLIVVTRLYLPYLP